MDENREFQIFENYTKSVCRKIMSKRKKNEVSEELYSHLLEEYERNSALGLDDETAQLKSIEKMGDQEKIADEFGALYSVVPTEYMRSSLNFIIWGMALTFFQINLFTGFGEITKFIGEMLLIYGLFKLRKTDKKFNRALFLNIALEIYYLVLQNIALYSIDYSKIQIISSFISAPLNLLVYWWIFSGAKRLCKNLIGDKDKQPHLLSGFIAYALCSVIIIFAALTELSIIAFITPIFIIFSLCQLGRAKKILAYKEPEFDLKETLKKSEKIVYWILVIILAVTPIISMLAAASPNVNTTIHNTADITAAKSEIDAAKKNMLELGFPKEYLKDLPDSEILKYGDATYLQIEKKKEYSDKNFFNNEKPLACSQIFNFYFADAEMRVLLRVDIPDDSIIKYRSGVYFYFYDKDFTPLYDGNGLDDYGKLYLALSERNGETVSTERLSEFTPTNSLQNFYTAGFEFKFEKADTNKRVYIAHSARISNPTIMQNMCTDGVLLWQQFPITADYKSINDMAKEYCSGIIHFSNNLDAINTRQLYNTFEFDESYLIEDKSVNFKTVN